MGKSIDPHEIKKYNKLTATYLEDNIGEEELVQHLNQLNESLNQMMNAMEELSNQLTEYVATLN